MCGIFFNYNFSFAVFQQFSLQIYSNQKEIKVHLSFSPSNIYRACVGTRPPKLHNLLQISPSSIPDILCLPPPPLPHRASPGSAIHVFLVIISFSISSRSGGKCSHQLRPPGFEIFVGKYNSLCADDLETMR